ncbi:MAG: L,D-transpeptidase family protein [Gammaproteobacteria bacterium]
MARHGPTFRLRAILRLASVLFVTAVWALAPAAPTQAQSIAPAADALKQIIEEGNPAYLDWSAASSDRDQIGKLYEANGYRLLWSDGEKPTAAAISLLQQLRLAGDRGLDPEDYPGNRLVYLLIDLIDAPHAGIEQWALFDAGLSRAGVRFLSDVHLGRIDPATMGHDLSVGRIKLDIPTTLAHLATAVDVAAAVDALEPQFSHFALLKGKLSQYRALADEDGLTDLPPLTAKSLKPGEDYSAAAKLQQLLAALGDAAPPAPDAPPPTNLSPSIVEALKHFQSRHGEKPDGVLGAATFSQLTRPLKDRVRQIELTMERWRWLPSELVTAPIIVNIPQFRLFAFESTADSEAHIRQMDVIVGKSFDSTQTPVFAADMSYLVFRPYWEVPYSIALNEVVPTARNNPADIERRQMEIVSGGGNSAMVMANTRENVELVAKGTLRLRQRPGPNNSLGLVKFMMPNQYNVYLHSTPAQSLFAESRRDFSHGCVRVSDPVGLAQYVLRDAPEWTREKILAAMNGSSPQTVTLKNRIRVFIVYGTAIATEKGNILFFDDIYRHDERLQKALEARRVPSAANVNDGLDRASPP